MKLYAKSLEKDKGLSYSIYQADCTQEGYNNLWNLGKELQGAGNCTEYEIGVFTDSYRLCWFLSPDKCNYDVNKHEGNFLKCLKDELESFLIFNSGKTHLDPTELMSRQDAWMESKDFREIIDLKKSLEVLCNTYINSIFKGSGLTSNGIDNFTVHAEGDLKGYATGIVFNKEDLKGHQFLFRLEDAANGKSNTLVSIDCREKLSEPEKVFEQLEKGLCSFADKYQRIFQEIGVYAKGKEKKASLDELMAGAMKRHGMKKDVLKKEGMLSR